MPSGIDLLPTTLPSKRVSEAPDELLKTSPPGNTGPYVVILYDCDCHTFEDVITQLQKAIGCTPEKGDAYANEVHTQGRAVVHSGDDADCERVANILREIRLQVETDRSA